MTTYDRNDDEGDDDEPYEADGDDGSTGPCPYCGADIYDDAVRCPVCERYLSDEERTTTNQSTWVVITALLLLAAFLWSSFR